MRVRATDMLQLLAADETPEKILADFPYLEREDIPAVLGVRAARCRRQGGAMLRN
jgi:uncharacterized protein (DUF433 family)